MTVRSRMEPLRIVRWVLLLGGLGALGYVGYVYTAMAVAQYRDEVAFDEQLKAAAAPLAPTQNAVPPTALRSIVGRIEIPRLRVHAIVREGDDDNTLRDAVGHLPDTPLPGHKGNVAFAGHRDTLFRQLRNIRKNDRITVRTLEGEYDYVVNSMKIVNPDDVQVLNPTGGNMLTLVTCYPFNFVGHAPKRYVIRARQVSDVSPAKYLVKGPQPEAAQPPDAAVVSAAAVNKP